MSRFLLYAVIASSIAELSCAVDRPNVLLICVDDLKPTISCFGDETAITPNIDKLASRGVRFDAAYCNQAVCSPSRNSLMTGLRPQTIGVYDLPTHFRFAAPDAVTFSQHFKNAGYHAAGLGKIYRVGHGNIDDAESWSVPSWKPKTASYVLPESVQNIKPDANGKKRGPATEAADVSDETYADGLVAEEAVNRLKAAAENPDQPFFLAVGFLKPHLPFVAPQKYWELYDASQLPMPTIHDAPKYAPSYAATSGGELRNYSDMPEHGAIDNATTRHLIHGYYAATSYADAQIGKVLDAVDQLDLADNTIIVLWGDHGWHLGDHGMWCKHTNYQQATRIPLIVVAPNGLHGVASLAMVETVDIYPTIAELAGIKTPGKVDGVSFSAVVRDGVSTARDFVTHVYPRGSRLGRAIRDQRFRLVEWNEVGDTLGAAEIELYDYQTDPLETRNIAADHPEIVAAKMKQLQQQAPPRPQWKKSAAAKSTKKTKPATNNKPKPDRAAMFKKRDSNRDGFLDRDEFLLNQPDPEESPKRFPKFDTDGDGRLSESEFVGSGRS